MAELGVVTAEVPVIDDCPSLTRLSTYVTELGTTPIIEHVFRDRKGNPLDLSSVFPDPESQSESQQEQGVIHVRSKEIIANAGGSNPLIELTGEVVNAENGVVRFQTTVKQIPKAGIYQLAIAVVNAQGSRVKVDNPILWVERSLFGVLDNTHNLGPPTIQEIRQVIWDHGAADNLLLDDVEFTEDQIASAVSKPVMHWNEMPPPIRPLLDTRNFCFREHWINAIAGHLFVFAAHNYRRNRLPYNAGGVAVDDKNKESEYNRAGQELLDEYKAWVQSKKVEINASLMQGTVQSVYGVQFY